VLEGAKTADSGKKLARKIGGEGMNRFLAATAGWALLGSATHSWAQTSAGTAPNIDKIDEIVVTAEKRPEPGQKAPAAIVALGGGELEVRGIDNLVDLMVALPTAQFDTVGYASHLYLRGVGSGQDRITVDPLVGVSMDGVPLPREMQGTAQYDVNDVELLPGPQGTLYGSGAVAGLISIANKQPVDHDETDASIEVGNFASVHTTVVENIPLSKTIYVRGAIDYTSHSAYETGDAWTADDLNGRLSVLFVPNDDFTGNIWVQGTRDHSLPPGAASFSANGTFSDPKNPWDVTSCLSPTCNGIAPRSAFDIGPAYSRIDNFIAAGKFDWQFSGFTITETPSLLYSHIDLLEYLAPFDAQDNVAHHQVANELKAISDGGGDWKWLVGLYGYQDRANQFYLLAAPTYDVPYFKFQTLAPFGQVTYSINERLRLTGGARYTWDRKEATYDFPGPFPETSANWTNVDWKVGLEADVAPKSLAYATIQTASEPGTLDAENPIQGRPNATRNTNLLSFTVGSKNRFFDDRLEVNDEFYYYDYKHFLIQTLIDTTCGGVTCFTEGFFNPSKMTIYGDQLDLRWLVTENDRLTVGTAYNHARTTNFITPLGLNLDNEEPPDSPEVTVILSGQHTFRLVNAASLVLRGDSRYENGYYTDFETTPGMCVHCPGMTQKAFTRSSMSLTYNPPNGKWTIGLWVKNVENKAQVGSSAQYFGSAPAFQGAALINEPRTYGLRVTWHRD
jgi:iron complex outermembrane receptor protein